MPAGCSFMNSLAAEIGPLLEEVSIGRVGM